MNNLPDLYIYWKFYENIDLYLQTFSLKICIFMWNKISYLSSWLLLLLGFTTLFNILAHQHRFRHREWKSDKFCSEALISAWGSLTCRKSTTRDPRLYFPSEEVILRIFTLWKNPSTPVTLRQITPRSFCSFQNSARLRQSACATG